MEVKVNVVHSATLRGYTRLIIAFLFSLIALSVYQYITLYLKGVTDRIFGMSFILAIVHHIGFSALVGLVFVAPFKFFEGIKPRLGIKFTFAILVVLLLIELVLIGYYTITYVPLGSDILGYNFSDIIDTVLKSGGISVYPIIIIIVISAIFFGFFKFTGTFYHHISKMFPFTIILLSLFLTTLFTERKPINDNKTQYLAYNLMLSVFDEATYESNIEYPLLKENLNEDVLGAYFNLKEEKPNIVFIIVEGLGSDFVGNDAQFGGFTPFIDDLTEQSLYWDNFLSNTGRTYGVIPSLLGSLPFGQTGFMDLEELPNKYTLFSILKNNGYRTALYMGANSSFDHMDTFLRSENIDYILDRSKYESKYILQPADAAGASWGYPDKELFKKAMSVYKPLNSPRLDVFMTLTTHEPFIAPNQDYYEEKVEEILAKNPNYDRRTKKLIAKNKGIFGSLLYGDEALKEFLNEYKSKPTYNNTIFVITGDHRLIPVPQRNPLSRFQVPFLIYSPLLKSPKKISAVSSHLDVVPTLLAMLSKKYQMLLPEKTAWMGGTIDMHEKFRIHKDIPLMRNKNELKDFISKESFYSDGDLYRITSTMDLELSNKEDSKIAALLQDFKGVNTYVTQKNKIIPENAVIYKIEKEKFTKQETVWIHSQFNGNNFDNAYETAKQFAFDGDYDKSLLLIRYILSEVPSHIDAKILQGRVNAWKGEYSKAIRILEECLEANASYDDIYCALLDASFWADNNENVLYLFEKIQENNIKSPEVHKKVARAYKQLQKKGKESNTLIVNSKIEAFIAAAY